MSSSSKFLLTFLLLFIGAISIASDAAVPSSRTFRYVNEGEFGEYAVEYLAYYRVLSLQTSQFALCFYNSTPDAFVLGIRMGNRRSESIMRWVWDANRAKPVRENATLSFGREGNLVLADADGKVAWQTNTAGKGVSGLNLLGNGNLVLYDSKGRYVWQSFDHPTDTLLVGQTLKPSGPRRLVSRLSPEQPVDGPYSFVVEERHWAMYYQSKNSKSPLLYYRSDEFGNGRGAFDHLTFYCSPENDENYAFELGFTYNFTGSDSSGTSILTRPKYNATYSMLRVDVDGNLRIYTYDENVDWGAWEVTYVLFDRDDGAASECKLPKRCGSLGVCDEDQCVACPRPQGLLGWTRNCEPPKLPPCGGGGGGGKVDYYKVDGVEHYTSDYDEGVGPMSLAQCKDKCSRDCRCLGLFYRAESAKCLVVPEIGTVVKVLNQSHVGYIKVAK